MSEPSGNMTEALTETLKRLAVLVSENGLSELVVEENGVTLTVKAAAAAHAPVSVAAHPHMLSETPPYSQTIVAAAATATPSAPSVRAAGAIALESPMVGVFYRSPSPEDPPFVAVGDMVKIGQPIGLIEAMKVYSEVPSEVAGRVVEMPVESGKLVQQGQALIYVEPS